MTEQYCFIGVLLIAVLGTTVCVSIVEYLNERKKILREKSNIRIHFKPIAPHDKDKHLSANTYGYMITGMSEDDLQGMKKIILSSNLTERRDFHNLLVEIDDELKRIGKDETSK